MAERTFCTQCGCESDPAAPAQCPRCGAALELPPGPPQSVSSPAPQASTATSARSWLLIGCLAGLLFAVLVVAVGGWLLYRHLSPSRPQQTQSPDAVPSQQAPIESVSKKPSDTAPQQPRQELRRLLQPSTEPQRVEMEGMAVLVPGGLLAAPRELTIASIPQPPSPGDGLQVASAYDIRLGDQHLFEKPLTIELPYDPASLRPGTTPKHALMAAWWDESQKDWCVVPCEIDEARWRVSVKIGHLSILGMLMWIRGWEPLEADSFVIHYDPSQHTLPQVSEADLKRILADAEKKKLSPEEVQDAIERRRRSMPAAKGSTAASYTAPLKEPPSDLGPPKGQWPSYCTPNLPLYVRDVAVLLNVAFKRYQEAGFRMPANPIHVRLSGDETSSRNTFTELVSISLAKMNSTPLGQESAHELFHAVQNKYYWDIGMGGSRLWWIESSAEYASCRIGARCTFEKGLPRDYLSYALTDTTSKVLEVATAVHEMLPDKVSGMLPKVTDHSKDHEYQTAHFLDFIVRSSQQEPTAFFRAFFEQVVAADPGVGTAPLQGALQPMRKAVAETLNKPLYEVYRNFAAQTAFSQKSVCQRKPSELASHAIDLMSIGPLPDPRPAHQKIAGDTMQLEVPTPTGAPAFRLPPATRWTASLPAEGTARLCVVTTKEAGVAQIALAAKPPDNVTVDAYLLPGGERCQDPPKPVASLTEANVPMEIPLTPDKTLALLCTNSSDSDQTVDVHIGMLAPLAVRLTATPPKPGSGSKVLLTAQIFGGKPPYRARFAVSGAPDSGKAELVEGNTALGTAVFEILGPSWAEVTVSDETPKGTPVTKRIAFDVVAAPLSARLEAPEKRSPGQPIPLKLIIEGGVKPFACTGIFTVPETYERELTKETRAKEKGRIRLRTTVTDNQKREALAECSILIESSFDVLLGGPKQLRTGQEAKIDVTIKGGQAPYQVSVHGKPLGALNGAVGSFTYTAGQIAGRATVEVQATDAKGESGLGRLPILVLPAKDGDFTVIVQGPNGAIKRGEQGKFTVTIAGGQYPYRIFVNGKELPGNHGRVVPFTHQPTTRGTVEEVMVLVIDANGGGKLFPREVGVRD